MHSLSSWLLQFFVWCLASNIDRGVFGQSLPTLPNNACSLDTVYNSIKTGKVVEYILDVRYRDCPSNKGNQPCGIIVNNVTMPGSKVDGMRTNLITVNDMTPGPVLTATLGDTVRVTVNNYLAEPTTLHFHGITQFRTPYMDGDPYVSNCPILLGQSFTYEFIAHPAGTTFVSSIISLPFGMF